VRTTGYRKMSSQLISLSSSGRRCAATSRYQIFTCSSASLVSGTLTRLDMSGVSGKVEVEGVRLQLRWGSSVLTACHRYAPPRAVLTSKK